MVQAATTASKRKLRSLCEQYKQQVADNVEFLAKVPEETQASEASTNQYVQALIAVAQCLANECHSPKLWQQITGTPDDNPLLAPDQWFSDLPQRMQQLEFESLISEAESHLQKFQTFKGTNAAHYETFVVGRLGELFFQSGKVESAFEPFQTALGMCEKAGDTEGQIVYLNNLHEAHRYRGQTEEALKCRRQVLELTRQHGGNTESIESRIAVMEQGEPLCRVVCLRDGTQFELDEITSVGEGSYKFQFERNRISLRKTDILVQQGNCLASSGNLSDALEKYHEASDVDPHDPDPVYQSGMCLLELGAYGKAREAFEEVEQLAPGWFRCRSDIWLARSLEEGTVSDEQFRVLRGIEDGGMEPQQSLCSSNRRLTGFLTLPRSICCVAICTTNLGTARRQNAGIEVDYSTLRNQTLNLVCYAHLPVYCRIESPERKQLVERAMKLEGSLVAMATAKLMGLQ